MTCNCNDESNESNATECSETCPTTCATQTFVNSCGCNTGCGCNPSTPGTAVPYYNAAAGCEEVHKRVCIQSQYVTGISISNTFNMPACGQTAVLIIPGLQLINIGVYLWNTTYGYLKVTEFDFATSSVVVENECLQGNAAPGTTIPACTVFTIVDQPNLATSPCVASTASSGSLIVCSGGTMHPLDGSEIGQIPVLVDPANNIVQFQDIDIPTRICEELTVDLTLIAGNAGPYVITVTDTSTFAPGNLLQIDGRTDRFTVVLVTGPTTFTATVSPVPIDEVIPATTPVCHISCCEQNTVDFDYFINNPTTWVLTGRFALGASATNSLGYNPFPLPTPAFTYTPALTLTIPNPNSNNMYLTVLNRYEADFGLINVANPEWVKYQLRPQSVVNFCPIGTGTHGVLSSLGDITRHRSYIKAYGSHVPDVYETVEDYRQVIPFFVTVPPGQEAVIDMNLGLAWDAGSPGAAATLVETKLVKQYLQILKVSF